MSHTETQQVTYYSGHAIEVNGKRYAPERTCWNDSLKKGKGVFFCSACGVHLDITDMEEDDLDVFYKPNYCPNCGAKVIEREE